MQKAQATGKETCSSPFTPFRVHMIREKVQCYSPACAKMSCPRKHRMQRVACQFRRRYTPPWPVDTTSQRCQCWSKAPRTTTENIPLPNRGNDGTVAPCQTARIRKHWKTDTQIKKIWTSTCGLGTPTGAGDCFHAPFATRSMTTQTV